MIDDAVDDLYFTSSSQCGDMVGDCQVLGKLVLEVGERLAGIAVEHVEHGERRHQAVVIAAAERRIEEEVARLLEADQRAGLVAVALDVGVAGLPVERLGAVARAAPDR